MGFYGLMSTRRGFVLVASDGRVVARAAKADAALDALFERLGRLVDVQLVVSDDVLHDQPEIGHALAAHIALWIAPHAMLEDMRLLAAFRQRDPRRLGALLARLPSSLWLRQHLRCATPSSEHQLVLF